MLPPTARLIAAGCRLLLLAFVCATGTASPLLPDADAFVRNGAADTSHNVADLELAARGVSFSRKVYLAFDLNNALPPAKQFAEASLRLRFPASGSALIGTATGPVELRLHAIIDGSDVWSEAALTWNNAPKNLKSSFSEFSSQGVALLATTTLNSANLNVDGGVVFASEALKDFLNWAAGLRDDFYGTGLTSDPDRRITFMLSSAGGINDPGFRLASRESGVNTSPQLVFSVSDAPPPQPPLANAAFSVRLLENSAVEVTQLATGVSAVFNPRFAVLRQSANPNYGIASVTGALQGTSSTTHVSFSVPAWMGNADWNAAPGALDILQPTGVTRLADEFRWQFPESGDFSFAARVFVPAEGEPIVEWTLTPKSERYFSVSYIGAPAEPAESVNEIYQPGIWDGLRIPNKAYLVDESRCPLPLALFRKGAKVVGVIADPAEMPFRLPTRDNSRLGVTIIGPTGAVQPVVAAPLYGTALSRRSSPFTFRLRLVVRQAPVFDTFQHLAETLYGFADQRRNLPGGSLNQALDNITDFVLNTSGQNYSYWSANAKANDYVNDQPGYARHQSAVYALTLSMIRDDPQLFAERAVPSIEYFVSRQRNLFKIDGYDPGYPMGGPMLGTYVGDFMTLGALTGRRTPAFDRLGSEALVSSIPLENKIDHTANYTREQTLDLAKRWLRHLITYYRITGENRYLEDAVLIADRFIRFRLDQPPTDFRDTLSSFWAEISPIWEAFFELHEVTGEARYRDAAVKALQPFIMRMNFSPVIPPGEIVVENQRVPAWRVSEVGMISEAAGTSSSHRGIFMPYVAPALARAARYTGDRFYADAAKANIIGRFLNYPGYGYRNNYSIALQNPNYPLRWYGDYLNTAHMNHPLPLASMIVDYLIADAELRSKGSIWFPSLFSDTGAYFKHRVYGHAPGRFHGDYPVWPWMPRGLVMLSGTGSEQLNYVAGIGAGNLYLAFSNQSPATVEATLTLSARARWNNGARVRVWLNGEPQPDTVVSNGALPVSVPGDGLLALAIDSVEPDVRLQSAYANGHGPRLTEASYVNGTASFGRNVGMILSVSPQLQWAFVYTDAAPASLQTATLTYRIDSGPWQLTTKAVYPFEFSIPLPANATSFSYFISGSSGQSSDLQTLSLATSPSPPTPTVSFADATSESAVQLAWAAVPGATAYRLERLGPETPGFIVLPNLSGAQLSFTDTALQGKTSYLYRIRAVSESGESLWTSQIAIRTDSPLESWRRLHYGFRENAGDAHDAANPDGDWYPNLLEYALGGNPRAFFTGPRLIGRALSLPIPARQPDIALAAQVSHDLVTWTDAALAEPGQDFELRAPSFHIAPDPETTNGLLLVPPVEAERIFYRLEARQP